MGHGPTRDLEGRHLRKKVKEKATRNGNEVGAEVTGLEMHQEERNQRYCALPLVLQKETRLQKDTRTEKGEMSLKRIGSAR